MQPTKGHLGLNWIFHLIWTLILIQNVFMLKIKAQKSNIIARGHDTHITDNMSHGLLKAAGLYIPPHNFHISTYEMKSILQKEG